MKYYSLLLLLALFSCTTTNSTGGGSDHANFLKGSIKEDGNVKGGVSVSLHKTEILVNGNSTKVYQTVSTDDQGEYLFENIEEGKFVVSAEANGKIGIVSAVNIEDNSEQSVDQIDLQSTTVLYGRVVGKSNVTVSVIGLNRATKTDEDGFYSIDDVPTGKFEVLFISGNSLYELPVTISEYVDTTFIRDVSLETNREEYSFYSNNFDESYELFPVVYKDSTPSWYENKSFAAVQYKSNKYNSINVNENGLYEFCLEDFDKSDDSDYDVKKDGWYVFKNKDTEVLEFSTEDNSEDAFSGKSLNFSTNIVKTDISVFSGVGLFLTGVDSPINISDLDTVSFYAKGFGGIYFSVESAEPTDLDSIWGQYQTEITLSEEWKNYKIAVNDLELDKPNEKYPTVQDALKEVARLEFTFSVFYPDITEYNLHIDNIVFIGHNPIK